jgi:hypothetical protein
MMIIFGPYAVQARKATTTFHAKHRRSVLLDLRYYKKPEGKIQTKLLGFNSSPPPHPPVGNCLNLSAIRSIRQESNLFKILNVATFGIT